MIKLLAISGSPVTGSSTDFLLKHVMDTVAAKLSLSLEVSTEFIKLNDLNFVPCQACGKAPENDFCTYDDDLVDVYRSVIECDCLLFGSPVYFDSVSAQAKAFIDRCNCFRPPDFEGRNTDHAFVRRIDRTRPGAIILAAGERGWTEGARRVVAGFFKWTEVINKGLVTYRSTDFVTVGGVRNDGETLDKATELGHELATEIEQNHE
ncbi:MAG: flavodoxin family protein [candidate division Zixibacteria bacterium]|nr:flavodoxin family protein [candidate division Zixibacteria bacterium]